MRLEIYTVLKIILWNVIHVVLCGGWFAGFFSSIGFSLNHCTAGAKFIKDGSVEQLTVIRGHLERHLK